MTTKTLSLTLSRWHIVADRFNTKAKELQDHAVSVFSGTAITAFQGDEQIATLQKRREQALNNVEMVRRLIRTVGLVRQELAHENAKHGVSASLSKLDAIHREVKALSVFECIDNDSKINISNLPSHFKTLESVDQAGRVRMHNGVSVSMLPDNVQEGWRIEREDLQAQAHALSDTINDANRHTLTLTIDEDIAKVAGL